MFGLDLLSLGIGIVVGLVAAWAWTKMKPSDDSGT